jgi:hypothetical protein
MLNLDVSKNKLCAAGAKVLAEALRGNEVMTEINISDNHLGKKSMYSDATDMSGVIMLADVIPGMGALLSANFLGNKIPVEHARELVEIMQSKMKLTTLCGLSKEETELDFSPGERLQYRGFGPGDAVLIANDIGDMEALSSLNLANNNIGELVLPVGWERKSKDNDGMAPWFYEHTDGTMQDNNPAKPEGAIAIANAIPNMRALNISNNVLTGGDANSYSGIASPSEALSNNHRCNM